MLRRLRVGELVQEGNGVEYLELGESVHEVASFGRVGFHEVEKVAVRGEQKGGIRSEGKVHIFAVLGVALNGVEVRNEGKPVYGSQVASKESIDGLWREGRELRLVLRSVEYVADLSEYVGTHAKRNVTFFNQAKRSVCALRASGCPKKKHAIEDGERAHADLARLAWCSSQTSPRRSS